MACAGVQGPSGATNSAGGPLGGDGVSPAGSGAAAQPMDTGFSGPKKDIDSLHYVVRDGKALVLCRSGEGLSKLRFEGTLASQLPSGETTTATAPLRLTDPAAGHFLVTQTSMEIESFGYFRVEFKAGSAEVVRFDVPQNYSGPLDTILPLESLFSIIVPVEFSPNLIVEEGPSASLPCLEKVERPSVIQRVED